MPSSKKPGKPRRSRGSHTTGHHGAAPAAEPPPPPHVATIIALGALGWHVTEIRPSVDEPVAWRVTIERHDQSLRITAIDAEDPDAAVEELARYAAAGEER